MLQSTLLLEFVRNTNSLEVDTDAGVIRGIKIHGLSSANGRDYTRECVSRAIPLYEGVVVNVDHPSRPGDPVPVARRLGWLESVKQDQDGGLRADLHYLRTHPMADALVETAKRRPQLLGMSHNANGKTRREGGREIVESIESVYSVDLVADPATVKGLHEHRSAPKMATVKTLRETLKTTRPGWARALREMAESGVMSDADTMQEPAPVEPAPTEEADHEEALKAGFRAAIMAALDDDGLDMKAKLSKIKEILQAEEKLVGGKDSPKEEPKKDEPKDEKVEESRELARLRARDLLRSVADEAGVRVSAVLLDAVRPNLTREEAKALVESIRVAWAQPSNGARSATPTRALAESVANGTTNEEPKSMTAEERARRVAELRSMR